MATPLPVGRNPWDDDRRRSWWPLGCLIPAVAVGLFVIITIGWSLQHAGGVAAPDAVRPLPEGATLVVEQAGCPGNGKGWHLCERRLRFRAAGASRTELGAAIADHYRATGHVMERLTHECGARPCDSIVSWGDPACIGREPSGDVCLFVRDPEYLSEDGVELDEQPGDVDVVAESWANFP